MEIIEKALKDGRTALSEFESKQALASYGVPITKEVLVDDINAFSKIAKEIGYPLVLKGCSAEIGHKTEKDLLHVDIRNEEEGKKAFEEIMSKLDGKDGAVLVQEMIKGPRELVIGATRDPQFGPCVMFGLGGIFTEILKDVSFRIAPLEKRDAIEMMKEIKGHKILEEIRGMEPADLDILSEILINVGRFALENDRVKEVDINPVILSGSKPVAVDALIVLE